MQEQHRKRTGGCVKLLGVGCAVVIACVLLAGVLIVVNRDAITSSDWYRSVTEKAQGVKREFAAMMELRRELLELYPAQGMELKIRSAIATSGSAKSLVIEIINPRFDVPGQAESPEELARTIASDAAVRFPDVRRYDNVVVSFVKQTGAGVTFKNARTFSFSTDELLETSQPGSSQ